MEQAVVADGAKSDPQRTESCTYTWFLSARCRKRRGHSRTRVSRPWRKQASSNAGRRAAGAPGCSFAMKRPTLKLAPDSEEGGVDEYLPRNRLSVAPQVLTSVDVQFPPEVSGIVDLKIQITLFVDETRYRSSGAIRQRGHSILFCRGGARHFSEGSFQAWRGGRGCRALANPSRGRVPRQPRNLKGIDRSATRWAVRPGRRLTDLPQSA